VLARDHTRSSMLFTP